MPRTAGNQNGSYKLRAFLDEGAVVWDLAVCQAVELRDGAFGLGDRVRDINFQAVKIAREAKEVSGEPVFLAGSISSIGRPLAPAPPID